MAGRWGDRRVSRCRGLCSNAGVHIGSGRPISNRPQVFNLPYKKMSKIRYRLLAFVVCLCARGESLRGTVTDPSGAAVPGAAVEVRGPGGLHRAKTTDGGQYVFSTLAPGRYEIRVAAKGFDTLKQDV